LIIDDEKDVVELVKFLLEREGHQTFEASDGEEGLECARRERPDLIILDIMMPQMDGFTVSTHLMEREATRNIPIVILTAKGQVRDSFQIFPNVRYFIEKPFEPKDLKNKIGEILGKAPCDL